MDRHLPKCYYDTEFMDISFYSRLWCIMLYLFFFIFEIYDTSTTTEAKLSISTTTEATVDFNHMFVLISIMSSPPSLQSGHPYRSLRLKKVLIEIVRQKCKIVLFWKPLKTLESS